MLWSMRLEAALHSLPTHGASRTMTAMASIDTGMVVVVFISLMYMVLVFGLLFYVKNDWCDLLFKNFTVGWRINRLLPVSRLQIDIEENITNLVFKSKK